MKNTLIVAAAALLGGANAGMHRMKLQKVPLDQQLVCAAVVRYCSMLPLTGMDRALQISATTCEPSVRSTLRRHWEVRPRTSSGTPPSMWTAPMRCQWRIS